MEVGAPTPQPVPQGRHPAGRLLETRRIELAVLDRPQDLLGRGLFDAGGYFQLIPNFAVDLHH